MSINYISMENSILAICAKHESTIIFMLLQMRKLRHKQVKEFAQGYTAGSGRARTGAQGTCLQRSCFPPTAPYVLLKGVSLLSGVSAVASEQDEWEGGCWGHRR